MYESVLDPQGSGNSRLVASEPSVSEIRHGGRARSFGKWKLVLWLFGCALFCGACANDDSSAGNSRHRHHRHGNGHEQMETVDRSNNPSPTPALGW